MAPAVKRPGPDHPIVISPAGARVRVLWRGHTIADSERALSLQESNYPAVVYIPRADVAMDYLAASDHTSYCPYKGQACYFALALPGTDARVADAVWSYERPFADVAAIAGHLAFYASKVDAIERG